jgi:heme-degrading monooxygenase HmoA
VIIQIVRYKSGLSHEGVAEQFETRAARYREVPGLIQKYYVHFTETGEHGGVYVWESLDSLQNWRETNLAESLEETYKVERPPHQELADVMLVLRTDDASG